MLWDLSQPSFAKVKLNKLRIYYSVWLFWFFKVGRFSLLFFFFFNKAMLLYTGICLSTSTWHLRNCESPVMKVNSYMTQLWMFHAIHYQLADFENQICKTATSKQNIAILLSIFWSHASLNNMNLWLFVKISKGFIISYPPWLISHIGSLKNC